MTILAWILIAVAANWLLPLLMFIYPLAMMWIFKDFRVRGYDRIFPIFELVEKDVEPWHAKWWKDWCGVGLFGFMCVKFYNLDKEGIQRTILHEGAHVEHQVILGLLFWLAYIGHSVFIWFCQAWKHAYLDNWSERLARARAGQMVDIPRSMWPKGPNDRWPWW